MTANRQVPTSVLWKLYLSRKPFSVLGLCFTLLSLLVILPFTYTMQSMVAEPYQKYDVEAIQANGTELTAEIIDYSSMLNVTVNGEHPQVLVYKYQNDGKTITDRFQTMDFSHLNPPKMGDKIPIKVYNGQSIVKGLEPFSFPMFVFYFLPALFFILGTIFVLISLVPSLKTYKLYKHGTLKDATLTSLTVLPGRVRSGKPYVLATYYYTDSRGNKGTGESTTTDLSIMSAYKTGDTIKIFVSEENPEASAIAPQEAWVKQAW